MQGLYLHNDGACCRFAEIFPAKLGAQAKVQQKSNGYGYCRDEQHGSEAGQELCVGNLRDGVGGKARRQQSLNLSCDLGRPAQVGVRPFSEMLDGRADQLKAEHRQDEEHTHDFACATLGQPAFQPGEDRLHQDEIEDGEDQQHQKSPGK